MLDDQDMDVIICVIVMYDDVRKWNRKNIDNYREIYLEVSMDEKHPNSERKTSVPER